MQMNGRSLLCKFLRSPSFPICTLTTREHLEEFWSVAAEEKAFVCSTNCKT